MMLKSYTMNVYKTVVLEYLSVSQAVTVVMLSVKIIVKIWDILMLYILCIVVIIICLHQTNV
jgi:hypothetical protein